MYIMRRPAQYMAHSSCIIWGSPGSITGVDMKFVSVVGYRGPPSFQKKEKEYRKKTKVGMHHHDVYLRKIMYTYVCMYIVLNRNIWNNASFVIAILDDTIPSYIMLT